MSKFLNKFNFNFVNQVTFLNVTNWNMSQPVDPNWDTPNTKMHKYINCVYVIFKSDTVFTYYKLKIINLITDFSLNQLKHY